MFYVFGVGRQLQIDNPVIAFLAVLVIDLESVWDWPIQIFPDDSVRWREIRFPVHAVFQRHIVQVAYGRLADHLPGLDSRDPVDSPGRRVVPHLSGPK